MAQFKSLAQEGSFQANQTKVPDEVQKIEKEASRQLSGMNAVDRHLEKNQRIFLEAQKQAQKQEAESRQRAHDVGASNKKADLQARQKIYEIELANNAARSANKVNVLQELVEFIPQGIKLTTDIIKTNRENQQKAINQLQTIHDFNQDDFEKVAAVEDGMNKSAFMKTGYIREMLDNGQVEKAEAIYEHLYKGNGFVNYLNNATFLKKHFAQFTPIVNEWKARNPNHTKEQLEQFMTLTETDLRDITIDGKVVSPHAIASALPSIASQKSDFKSDIQKRKIDEIKLETSRNSRAAYLVAIGEEKNWQKGNKLLELKPASIGNILDFVGNDPQFNSTDIANLRESLIAKNGKMVKVGDFVENPAWAEKLLEYQRAKRKQEDKDFNQGMEAESIRRNSAFAKLGNELAADGFISLEDKERLQKAHDRIFPLGTESPLLQGFMNEAVDARALNELDVYVTANYQNMSEEAFLNLPVSIQNKFSGIFYKQNNAKNSSEYKDALSSIDSHVLNKIRYRPTGEAKKNNSVVYMQRKLKQEFKEIVKKLLPATGDSQEAINQALALTYSKHAEKLDDPNQQKLGRYIEYEGFVDENAKKAAESEENVLAIKALTYSAEKRDKASEYIPLIGGEEMVAAEIAIVRTTGTPTAQINALAKIRNELPIKTINWLGKSIAGDKFEEIKLVPSLQGLMDRLPPKVIQAIDLCNDDGKLRAICKGSGTVSTAPVRPSFSKEPTSGGGDYSVPDYVKSDTHFMNGIRNISAKYKINENDLLRIISFETGGTYDPAQRNKAGSGATGLIQFMPSTARGLGTTTEALAKMSRTEQLQYVDKYLSNKGIEGGSYDDLYMAILFPAAVGKSDDYVLFGEGATISGYGAGSSAYSMNSGLDTNKDGKVTKSEAAEKAK